jgi:SAM-dependent methyltransferase
MTSRVPRYCDAFVAAFEANLCGDHLHLGFWDIPPPLEAPLRHGEFELAQKRLTDRLIALLSPRPHTAIIDIACGLGGTMREIDAAFVGTNLTGLNIDPKQIALCRRMVPRSGVATRWVVGDACALPFASESFDAALCIEAMFHFSDRRDFFREVSRILKTGSRLVFSDILLMSSEPFVAAESRRIEEALRRDYGPWPSPWLTKADVLSAAAEHGFDCVSWVDATAETLPSYRVIAPRRLESGSGVATGAQIMRAMHETGHLRYVYASFAKREATQEPACVQDGIAN